MEINNKITKPPERSKWWPVMCDILEEQFPKKLCKERGEAIVMLAKIEFLLLYGEEKFKEHFSVEK